MTQELTVQPQEFGLTEEKGLQILQSFSGKITELRGLQNSYNQLITKELNDETIAEAKELKKKISKTRISAEKIRIAKKANFLNGGRFVDSQGNVIKVSCTEMETVLDEMINHEANKIKEQQKELEQERLALCEKYNISTLGLDLGKLPNEVFDAYVKSGKDEWEKEQARLVIEQNRDKTKLHILSLNLDELLKYELLDDELKDTYNDRLYLLQNEFNKEQWRKEDLNVVDFTYMLDIEKESLIESFNKKSIDKESSLISTLNLKDLKTHFVTHSENKELKETRLKELIQHHYNEQILKQSIDKVDFSFLNETQINAIKKHFQDKQDEVNERSMNSSLMTIQNNLNTDIIIDFETYKKHNYGKFQTEYLEKLSKLESAYNTKLQEQEKRKLEVNTLVSKLYKPLSKCNKFIYDLNEVRCIEINNITLDKVDKFNERQKQIETDRLKSLGENEQLLNWISTFKISDSPINNDISAEITNKFNSFVAWANKQIK